MLQLNDYEKLIEMAIEEDINGICDITSEAIFSDETASAELISKDNGILAGCEIFQTVFKKIDEDTEVTLKFKDGDKLNYGDSVSVVNGKAVSILKAERIAINFISFLSGISTKTYNFVKKTKGNTIILDTRKTLPGYRKLSKYAVKTGGGKNHRMGLYDMVMIKDNHIDAAGSITKAVELVRKRWGASFTIEVECRTENHVKEALKNNVDIIMLDNMDNKKMKECVKLSNNNIKYEASGGMILERINEVGKTGVDYISVGELTHSVTAFDFSLKIKNKK